MKKSIVYYSLLLLLLNSCNKFPETFYKTPDYIKNATGMDQEYFKAYDKVMTLWDVDYQDLYIPTTYGTAHVIVSGPENGDPLVLLHGMTASSTMWYPNIRALTQEYRIYAIDLIIEPGKSHLTKEIEELDGLINWYYEVFKALELKDYSIIGTSRGGWIAVDIALKSQEDLKSLVLISPAQTFIWVPPSKDLIKNIIYQLSSDEKRTYLSFKTLSENVDEIDESYLRQNYLGGELDSVNKFVINMKPFTSKELQSIKVPTLVLIGDDDMINNSKSLEVAEENIPHVTTKVVNKAGHFLSVDQSEVVDETILKFLGALE